MNEVKLVIPNELHKEQGELVKRLWIHCKN